MLEQLVELAADLGGRVAVRREIILVFILQRRVVKFGECVVLQGEFQRDLLAAVSPRVLCPDGEYSAIV